jgi:hypothetical protein
MHKMIYALLFRLLFSPKTHQKVPLGRWGYHWEINKNIQKYYD